VSHNNDRIALYTAVNNAFSSVCPIRFDTLPEADGIISSDSVWIHCELEPIKSRQKSLGATNPMKRTLGLLTIKIYDREENGSADIFDIMELIETTFLHKSFNSGTLYIDDIQFVNKSAVKGWICKLAIVHYHSDLTLP